MAVGTDQDMEVWKQVFQELIQEVKPWHKWTLTPDKDLLPNALQPGWMQYQQWTFARFLCSSCSRSWASAHVQVLFHMHWHGKKHRGQVKMRVFTQRCKRCPQAPFEAAEFTQENITRILNNLVFRILKKCYREGFKLVEEIPVTKEISLEGPHDSYNCEACLQGFCAQSGLDLAAQSPVSPSLPTPSKDTGEPTATCTNLACSQRPSRVDKLLASVVNPRVPDPPKANPKVSCTSKTSTALILPTQHLPPLSTVSPKVPDPPKPDPKVSRTSKTSTALILPTQHLPPMPTVSPKVPDPPKADPKVSHTSKPSTTPTLPIQQGPPLSSLTLGLAIQMPPPAKSRTAPDAPTRDRIPKTGKVSSSSSSFAGPTWSMSIPTSWSPTANTTHQMQRSNLISPTSEDFYSHMPQNCTPGSMCFCRCCLILILVIIVLIVVKTII